MIWGASPQSRSDRQKDRVETNPEQLAAASAQAEISFLFFAIITIFYFVCICLDYKENREFLDLKLDTE